MSQSKQEQVISSSVPDETPEGHPNNSNNQEELLQNSHSESMEVENQDNNDDNRKRSNIDAIKFMETKFFYEFNDDESQKLFKYYLINKNTNELTKIDIRYMLFDLINAYNNINKDNKYYPLFIPNECLLKILNELCLQKKNNITWIEFKSFFVFLQDKPLFKLFNIIKSEYQLNDFNNAKLINIIKKPFNKQNKIYQSDINLQNNEYDTNIWKGIIKNNILPTCKSIYIHKNENFNISCLCLGIKDEPNNNNNNDKIEKKIDNDDNNNDNNNENNDENDIKSAEIEIDNVKYDIIMSKYDYKKDMFPRVYRVGGIKSQISRKIADTIVYAKEWDNNHLKIGKKTDQFFKNVSKKIIEIDEKHKISENIKNKFDQIKKSDSVQNIKTGIDNMAKNIDEKLKIKDKYENVSKKMNENEKIQKIKKSVSQFVNDTSQNIKDIKYETTQNIIQKESEIDQIKKKIINIIMMT